MGPGQNFLTQCRMRVIFFLLGSGWPPPGLKNFLQKSQIYYFLPLSQKNLIRMGQKNTMVQSGSTPLFTTGQKYAQVG